MEALMALAILSAAAISTITSLGAALANEEALREREHEIAEADRVLSAMSLLTRSDLDIRLGKREVKEFLVDVQRPEPSLYRVAVASPRAPQVELLVTVLYRPAPNDIDRDRVE